MFKQGAFQIDPNATPDQIARKREMIRAMMPKYGSAKYVGEGLGQLFYGIGSGRQENALDKQESAGRKSAADQFSRLFGTANSAQSADVQGPMSVLGMTPEATPAMPPADPNAPGAIAGDAMAALGKPAAHDHGSHPGQSHGDWLKYSNHSAVRNDPLDAQLVDAMSFVGDMGITMDVISGGQEAAGEGGARKGSVRHDHGKSADVDFYKDGRKLDWNNPNDLPVLQEIVRTAKANGITGVGAGDDYMGAGRFHIGFGSPAVWGAGGKSANAPAWLVEAYNGAPSGASPAPSGSAAPAPTSAPAIPINELYMALQNPWMSAEEKGLITSMIQEQQAASDPMRQLELRKAEIELAQLENPTQQPPEDFATRMFTLNALQIDPQSEEGKVYLMTGKLPEPPEPGYTTMTAEEVAQLGLPPGAYQKGPKGEIKQIGGGGTNVTVNNVPGTPPSDEALRKKLMEAEGTSWGEYLKAGGTASGMRQDMELLGQVIEMAPQGPVTGRLAEAFPGVSDAAGVFQSVVKRIAPSLRVEGSGAQSDIEYNGFLQSLPSLSNRPEANRAIKTFLESKAAINMERGQVIQEYQNGEIDAAAARKKIKEIDSRSIMSPELEGLLGEMDGGAATSATPAPNGVEQEVWDALTPEERALWD